MVVHYMSPYSRQLFLLNLSSIPYTFRPTTMGPKTHRKLTRKAGKEIRYDFLQLGVSFICNFTFLRNARQ